MSDMARPDEDFGKDHGLIHEAVITGRKVGAGQTFWAKLAHNEDLFRKVVDFVTNSSADVKIIETETSRRATFLTLVQKHIPNVIELRRTHRNVDMLGYFGDYGTEKEKKGIWSKDPLDIVDSFNRIFSVEDNTKALDLSRSPFVNGWTNITITIYKGDYLDSIGTIAKEYSRLTGKGVTLEKEF